MGDDHAQMTLEILESIRKDAESMAAVIEAEAKDDELRRKRYPFPSFSSWGKGKMECTKELETGGVPPEMLNLEEQPVMMDFKAVMQTLQKTIAIDHAKKVREGKESLNMNGILRAKYSDDNYYFPDRILNSGLSKKDFTAPFLILVKAINQDCGKFKEEKKLPSPNKEDVDSEENRKRKEPHNDESDVLVASPTLFAMLEQQPGSKRLRSNDSGISVTPQVKSVNSASTTDNGVKTVPSILSKTLTSTVTVSRVTRSSMPSQTASQQVLRNGNGATSVAVPERPKQPVAIKPKPNPTPTQFVSIRPKLPITVITPDKNVPHNQQTMNKGKGDIEKDQDDDFSPKIVNTQGSVVITKAAPQEVPVNTNGHLNTSPPGTQMLKMQSRKTYENPTRVSTVVTTPKPTGATSVRGSGFLGCKTCGKTFPSNCDNLYRNHMIIKHAKEVTDTEILDAKIQVTSWYKCKRCSLMVLNNLEEHNKRCSPDIPFAKSFDAIQVLTDDVPKLYCGLCPEFVESRIHLRAHLNEHHPEISNKVLLDPYYRCSCCLQQFSDTSKLISHVSSCTASTPSLETAQELAQKNLYCEICAKKHSKIRETLFCYQVKTLLRCVLCLHVSISRANFFNHLKVHHNRRSVGLCCPFCNDDNEKPTRLAFDHFIDHHYNVALKRAGEAALVRGRINIQNAAAANKSAAAAAVATAAAPQFIVNNDNNNMNRNLVRLTRPVLQQPQRRSMPTLRPKTVLPSPVQQQTATDTILGVRTPTGLPQTIRVPVSQVLRMGSPNISLANAVVGNLSYPPGTVLTARPIIINNRGGISQIPAGYTVVPATNIPTATIGNTLPVTMEPMDTTPAVLGPNGEDSILGM